MSEKKTEARLSNEDYQIAFAHVVTDFDRSVLRIIQQETQVLILEKFTNLYYSVSLSQFFVLRNLKELTEDIFENDVVKSFLFDYTDIVCVSWSIIDLDYKGEFLDRLVDAICLNRARPGSYSLVDTETLTYLDVTRETLKQLFTDNVWLVVLYLLLMNFDQTTVFHELKKTSSPKGKTNA